MNEQFTEQKIKFLAIKGQAFGGSGSNTIGMTSFIKNQRHFSKVITSF
jgi:hypothetical protein